jgi:hypothetical protein
MHDERLRHQRGQDRREQYQVLVPPPAPSLPARAPARYCTILGSFGTRPGTAPR